MNNEINEQLNTIKAEDLIWIVSFFLVLASLISNQFERDAILENNLKLNNISSDIKIIIFTVALIIYIYFVNKTWQSVEKLKRDITANNQRLIIEQAKLVAALLFLIGGSIFLITEIQLKEAN